ncbi:hypothetical protein, partial [Streptomyces sp. NPDC054794]
TLSSTVSASFSSATGRTVTVLTATAAFTATTGAATVTATVAAATGGTVTVLAAAAFTAATGAAALAAATVAVSLVTVEDAAVSEVTGVAAAVGATPESAEAAAVTAAEGTVTAAVPTEAAAEVAPGTETAVAEATGAPAVTEATVRAAEAALGAAETTVLTTEATLGTATEAALRTAGVVPEPAEVTEAAAELAEAAAHLTRRLDQLAAQQALGVRRRRAEAEGALVAGAGGTGQLRPVVDARVVDARVVDAGVVRGQVVAGHVVDRHVVVRERMGRAPEEQGRFGQSCVECGRSPVRTGLDAQGTQFGHLRGREAESSGHLVGVTVELGSEGRVDGEAGHGIAKGVVGHVVGSPWVCGLLVPSPAELRIPPGRRQLPIPAIPTDACRDGYRGHDMNCARPGAGSFACI